MLQTSLLYIVVSSTDHAMDHHIDETLVLWGGISVS